MDKNEWVGLDVGESDDWLTTHMDYYYRLMTSATKIPKSRFGKLDGVTDFMDIKVNNIIKLNVPYKKEHVYLVLNIGNTRKKYYISNEIRVLDLTLKEQTGFDYISTVYSHDIVYDKGFERNYKIKQLLNGRNTKVQQQRKRAHNSTRQQGNLAIPFSCD